MTSLRFFMRSRLSCVCCRRNALEIVLLSLILSPEKLPALVFLRFSLYVPNLLPDWDLRRLSLTFYWIII